LMLYLQVAEAKSQYREDARTTAGAMLLTRGRRTDALKQYEALATEAEKPAAKAEAAVRAGLIALDLAVADRTKIDSAMVEEAKDARYQRLINIYNSDPNAVIAEVDEYLKTNPTSERADQAKLLKAEALYKEQKFAEAAPFYEELRASQLTLNLRSEAAYKL